MADGSITIDTSINQDGIKKGTKQIESGFDKLKSTVARTIATIGVGKLAKDFISTGIQYNAEIEKYQTALTTLTGSAEKANKIIQQIKQDAAKTPFDVKGLTQANQLLISAGLSAEDARETILALGNAVSATGGGSDELSRMAVNLQQIKNLGKATSMDIKQFAMAGIDIYGLLADYLGVTKKEAAEMEVTWDNLNGALISASQQGGKYFGAMGRQSATLNGQWSTLKDNFKEFAGKALTPVTNILKDKVLPAINDILTGAEKTKKWINEHKTILTILVGIIGTLTAAIVANTIAKNLDLIVIWAYVTATSAAATITGVFSGVLAFLTSPITLVVLAIGGLVTAIVLLVKNWETVKQKTLAVWENIKTGVGAGVEKVKGFFSNMGEKINEKVNNIKTKLGEFASKMKEVATTKIPQAINNISNFFSQLPAKLWSHLTNAISRFQNFCINLANRAKDGAKKAVNAIKNGFANLPQNMVSIGTNIVKGIWNGIGNTANWLFEKIKGFKDVVLNKFKSFFGIHSPSTLFRDEIGEYLALGIGEGFNDSIGSVYKKMQSAVNLETQKLGANVTASSMINVERNSNITATLKNIENDKEITVNAVTNLDGKVLTQTVNKVNARQKLAYGLA